MPRTQNWTSTRQSVLVAVFLANFMNFTIQWLARKSKDQQITERIRTLRFKVFIFGLLSLFACNLVHSGIFVSVVAWLLLVNFGVLHFMYFKEFQNKIRAIVNLILHGMLVVYVFANVTSFATEDDT